MGHPVVQIAMFTDPEGHVVGLVQTDSGPNT